MLPDLFKKPIEALTAADAEGILGWPETVTVEFKRELSARDGRPDAWHAGGQVENDTKSKLFKEVVAFANTSGGHLVVGVAEDGAPSASAASISPVPRCVDLADRLARAAAQLIDPPIPLLLVRGVPTQDDGSGIVVFRVPESRLAPHRAPDKNCYIRRGTESVPIGMREIQEMTLAGGRRDVAIEERFAQAARVFERWYAEPQRAEAAMDGASFRVTAVPVGARFDLGRLYGRDGLVHRGETYTLRRNGQEFRIHAASLLRDSQPILRGIRWTSIDAQSYLAAYGEGAIEFACRMRRSRHSEPFLALGSIVAHVVNVLWTADKLRTAAGVADSEYGVEVELRTADPAEAVRLVWGSRDWHDSGIGRGLQRLPLVLPRLSFGSMGEVNDLLSILVNDICDAAAQHREEPWRVEVVP